MRVAMLCGVFGLTLLACNGGDKGATSDSGAATDDTGAGSWRPDLVCPGDAGCETNEGQLSAGASSLSITPLCFEDWNDLDGNSEYDSSDESFNDCGCDKLCEGDEGWTAADEGEGDGVFQASWMAGFQQGRPAQDVHDELWARTIAVRSGDTTVAIVALDAVGFFYNNVAQVQEELDSRGVDVDQVVVHATHQHEGPDLLGQWGPRTGKTGVDSDHLAYVIEQTANSVEEAVAALEPATLHANAIDTAAPFGDKGTRNLIRDSRDPVVVDHIMYTARFVGDGGDTIASLVNWGNHPEVLSDENTSITSDYPHYLREFVENGVSYDSYDVAGIGGVCIYINASVGGLMTPLGVTVTDGEGVDHSSSDFDKAEAMGQVLAELALESMGSDSEQIAPTVAVRSDEFFIPIENYAFQAMFLIDVFDRPVYNYDESEDLDDDNIPELLTRMDLVDIGGIRILTIPGEPFPELAVGGYDGSLVNTTEDDFIDPENPNPPDVDNAPEGPYFVEQMGAEYNWIMGLGNDEVGYLIPSYDYVLDDALPFLEEAEGDHYEETNSVGPEAVPRIEDKAAELITWTP